jgi:bifunctional ADP-heptose synthase (sugar kinase/adenylyltransferase)
VNVETDRAAVLAALESVDGVCLFTGSTATDFLAAAQPDIYVKGGDYTLETLNPDERRAVETAGGKIVLVPLVPGKSTTGVLEKISKL